MNVDTTTQIEIDQTRTKGKSQQRRQSLSGVAAVLLTLLALLFSTRVAAAPHYMAVLGTGFRDTGCDTQIWNYTASHPNAFWTGAYYGLNMSTFQGALEAMKAAPCGDYNLVQPIGPIPDSPS